MCTLWVVLHVWKFRHYVSSFTVLYTLEVYTRDLQVFKKIPPKDQLTVNATIDTSPKCLQLAYSGDLPGNIPTYLYHPEGCYLDNRRDSIREGGTEFVPDVS